MDEKIKAIYILPNTVEFKDLNNLTPEERIELEKYNIDNFKGEKPKELYFETVLKFNTRKE